MHSEDIKLLMAQSSRQDLISFAGGMPNNDIFPVKEIGEIYADLSDHLKKLCFQYGPTTGYPPLVRSIQHMLVEKGLPANNDRVLVTTGSLQAISIVTQEFINEGDIVLTENPCFVGALSVFETYRAKIIGIPIDAHGIQIDALKKTISTLRKPPKFLYVTPNFHNPAGIIYSLERRKALLEVLSGTDIILLEDDAYGDLYFDPDHKALTRPIKSMSEYGVEVIYTGSFSKILGPGFRLGYMLSSPAIFEKAEKIKQAQDACTSNFTQILANEFIEGGYLVKYLGFLRKEYQQREELLAKSMKKYMPAGVQWLEPKGGFYMWVQLPSPLNATTLFKDCIKRGVVFVTGRTFDPDSLQDDHLRLSYSNMPKKYIEKGVRLLSEVIRDHM